ncbi:GNAT family N-acetyltransferase [Neobacillus sp. LXY-1]|uniref:GNAT family N-acetyltransferase n=1 Tax=Neobacillus sp. LXY-1 TaxID=3379133 RepID=UPI003EDECF3B
MEIKFAEISDAPIIHDLMFKAFMEYKDEVPPSSALEETVQSITSALIEVEKSIIAFVEDEPVGMVRFQLKEEGLYFYRLSVIPEKQGQGIAKKLLASLEEYAHKNEISTILCKVRMTMPKNIQLYSSIGYSIDNEEVVHKPNGINIQVVSMLKKL